MLSRGQAIKLELSQLVFTNSIEPLLDMVEAELGIALLSDFIVEDALAAGRLAVVLDRYVHDRCSFSILWPFSRSVCRKSRHLRIA